VDSQRTVVFKQVGGELSESQKCAFESEFVAAWQPGMATKRKDGLGAP
jgi:hypothetical protein